MSTFPFQHVTNCSLSFNIYFNSYLHFKAFWFLHVVKLSCLILHSNYICIWLLEEFEMEKLKHFYSPVNCSIYYLELFFFQKLPKFTTNSPTEDERMWDEAKLQHPGQELFPMSSFCNQLPDEKLQHLLNNVGLRETKSLERKWSKGRHGCPALTLILFP